MKDFFGSLFVFATILNMIINLRTNDPNQVFEISELTLNSFFLYVNSYGYSGSTQFSDYREEVFTNFVEELSQLVIKRSGEVILLTIEDDELTFTLSEIGHLKVSGKFSPHNVPHQELVFGFMTDQTCLAPFIAHLRKARNEIIS